MIEGKNKEDNIDLVEEERGELVDNTKEWKSRRFQDKRTKELRGRVDLTVGVGDSKCFWLLCNCVT